MIPRWFIHGPLPDWQTRVCGNREKLPIANAAETSPKGLLSSVARNKYGSRGKTTRSALLQEDPQRFDYPYRHADLEEKLTQLLAVDGPLSPKWTQAGAN